MGRRLIYMLGTFIAAALLVAPTGLADPPTRVEVPVVYDRGGISTLNGCAGEDVYYNGGWYMLTEGKLVGQIGYRTESGLRLTARFAYDIVAGEGRERTYVGAYYVIPLPGQPPVIVAGQIILDLGTEIYHGRVDAWSPGEPNAALCLALYRLAST